MTTIADLKPDPRNVRQHNPRNIGMIVNALQQVGAARSIVLDEDNVILAGNGVIEAAAEAGIERVRIIEADGEEIIAVRRSGLTAEQKQKLALYDNRTAELAEWDTEALADIGEELDLGEFFTGTELAILDQRFVGEGDDPYAEWQGMPEFEQEDQSSYQAIHVHFRCREHVETFARLVEQKLSEKTRAIWYPEAAKIDMKSERFADES
ncbi:hypothetical protein CMI37_13060 [Candidatus Pacearchaeota archaeon]|nr:hypothetical protein [Candidatus Pacearchaeota archaeon]